MPSTSGITGSNRVGSPAPSRGKGDAAADAHLILTSCEDVTDQARAPQHGRLSAPCPRDCRSPARPRRHCCQGRRGAAMADCCFLGRTGGASTPTSRRSSPGPTWCRCVQAKELPIVVPPPRPPGGTGFQRGQRFASALESACWPRGRPLTRPSRGVELRRHCTRAASAVEITNAIARGLNCDAPSWSRRTGP